MSGSQLTISKGLPLMPLLLQAPMVQESSEDWETCLQLAAKGEPPAKDSKDAKDVPETADDAEAAETVEEEEHLETVMEGLRWPEELFHCRWEVREESTGRRWRKGMRMRDREEESIE